MHFVSQASSVNSLPYFAAVCNEILICLWKRIGGGEGVSPLVAGPVEQFLLFVPDVTWSQWRIVGCCLWPAVRQVFSFRNA
jgi:hypothetical protein